MTKAREPMTYDAALVRIADRLGWDEMAKVTGRKERTVRNWADPDTGETCPVDCAELLDLAYRGAGGEGYPMADTMARRLELAATVAFADQAALSRTTERLVKEAGEAFAALIAASREGVCFATLQNARREVSEMADEATGALRKIDAMLGQLPGTASSRTEQ